MVWLGGSAEAAADLEELKGYVTEELNLRALTVTTDEAGRLVTQSPTAV